MSYRSDGSLYPAPGEDSPEDGPLPKGKIYKNYPEAVSVHGGDARCPICGVPTGSYLPHTWYDEEGSKYAFFCGDHSQEELDKCR